MPTKAELYAQMAEKVTTQLTGSWQDVYKRQDLPILPEHWQMVVGKDKKKSVVDQLKSQPKAEHKKTAPKKSEEREI